MLQDADASLVDVRLFNYGADKVEVEDKGARDSNDCDVPSRPFSLRNVSSLGLVTKSRVPECRNWNPSRVLSCSRREAQHQQDSRL